MDTEKAITLANQYGISTVLCILMVGVLVWVLKWVFDTSKSREEALAKIINTSLTGLTTSLGNLSVNIQSNTTMCQEITRNIKDGFDIMAKADTYQREEHRELGRKIDENNKTAESAREKILNAIGDNECQAKK